MIIDTHLHTWNFQRARYEWLDNDSSILNRNYHIEDIDEERKRAGITAGVLVQAANNEEDTLWMLEVAKKNEWIKGVVGWLPLTNPEASADALENKYAANTYFKGIRHMVHDEADPQWLLQQKVIESLGILAKHNLPYDMVGVLPEHIDTAIRVGEKLPDLKMIFDHLNQPPIASKERFGDWGEKMRRAAANKNFFVKISGLGTASKKGESWTAEDVKPYIEFVLEHFGEDRCMCGSDWPVSLLAGHYERTWQVYKDVLSSILNEEGKQNLFYRNAEKFYSLNEG